MSRVAFFITGTGRSGTKWLAKLLNESRGVRVYHEPLMRKAVTLIHGHRASGQEAVRFLRQRKERMIPPEGQRWGEVNHYLRHWVEPLRTVFPGVPIVGLVRDGKDTVNSLVHRGIYGVRDRRVLPTPPNEGEGQFAKCCWFWADAYERLLAQRVPIWTLESLNETYSVCESFCGFLGIELIAEAVWKEYAGRRIHPSRLSVSTEWTSEQQDIFDKWAGGMQRRLGYSL